MSVASKVTHIAHSAILKTVHAVMQQGQIEIDTERCKGCQTCIDACPAQTLELSKQTNMRGYQHSVQQRPADCIGCATCALVCPDGCITVYRKRF